MDEFVKMLLTYDFLLVAVALGVIGIAIKAIPKIPSWTIPFVNTLLGALAMMAIRSWDIESAFIGACAAGVASLAYEAFKQAFNNFIKPKIESTTPELKDEVEQEPKAKKEKEE